MKSLFFVLSANGPGRCYSRDALEGLLKLCGKKDIHLISDEIYALSTYQRDDRASEQFTSVRSINLDGLINPRQVHVLYGMSKVGRTSRGKSMMADDF